MTARTQPGEATPLLSLTGVEAAYGLVRAIRGVSLHVDHGEIVALLGANGAGKTTLLRSISHTVEVSGGRIEFDGREISREEPSVIVRAGIGHVPEGREVFPLMTVHENLVVGAHLRPDRDQVARDIELYQSYFPILKRRESTPAGLLSGGEQQMLAIARAMMGKPRLILMDEPSLGLSPLLTGEIFEITRSLNREQGVAILLVEQNVGKALEIANRAYVLVNGRVAVHDDAAKLARRDDLQHFYLGGTLGHGRRNAHDAASSGVATPPGEVASEPVPASIDFAGNGAESSSLWSSFAERRTRDPDRPFLRTRSKGLWRGLSWQQACGEAERFAQVLQARGVKRGDRVALTAMDGRDGYVAALAVMRLGAVAVPLDRNAGGAEIARRIAAARCRVVIGETELSSPGTAVTYAELRAGQAGSPLAAVEPDASDPAVVIFTGAGGGRSRPVSLSHRQLADAASAFGALFAGASAGNCAVALPSSTALGFLAAFYGPLVAPITVCLPEPHVAFVETMMDIEPDFMVAGARDIERLWRRIELGRSEATALNRRLFSLAVGDGAVRRAPWSKFLVRNICRQFGLVRCRLAISAHGSVAPKIVRRLVSLGVPVTQVYGLAETAGLVTADRTPVAGLPGGQIVNPGLEIDITNGADIRLRATARQGEWLVTGDRGRWESGRIVVEGRGDRVWTDPQGQAVNAFMVERALRAVSIVADAAVTSAPPGTMKTAIALDMDAALLLARRHGLAADRPAELLIDADFVALVTSTIRSQCDVAALERIGAFDFWFDAANA